MNEFEIFGKQMIGMLKVMKKTLPMMSQIRLKTTHNKVVLGQYYKKQRRWQKSNK
jgi:hypothetical protein